MIMTKIKKAKGTKKCVVKQKLKFEGYDNYKEVNQLIKEIDHLEKVSSLQIDQKITIKNS